jgi:hypothetical protein
MGLRAESHGIPPMLCIEKHFFNQWNENRRKFVGGGVEPGLNFPVPLSNYWKHTDAVMEAVPVVKVWDLANSFLASLSILDQIFISTAHPDSNFAKNTP